MEMEREEGEGGGVKMDKRFEHPWFSILADIKKEAKEKGLTEDDARSTLPPQKEFLKGLWKII